MKKILLSIFAIGCMLPSIAQNNTTGVVVASEFHVTRPLRDIFAENPVDETKLYTEKESKDREKRVAAKFPFTVADGAQYGNDAKTIQSRAGDVPALQTKANIAGQTASGFRPFDPSGAVGPNHYIQMINSTTFKVYNKSTMAVMLTATLGNLWSPATANAGDPIVMYDKAADRWFLAQFGTSTDKKIYIAVSTTNDPTGSYYTYTYVSPQFPDYLKFSVWADGYYMTSNQSTQKVFCFERNAMIAGTPGARSIYVNYSPPKSGFFVPLPGDAADGALPTAGTPCPIFSYSDNGWGTSYTDAVNIYNMTVNWATTPTASISLAANIPAAAFDASYASNWNDVSQPGTTQKLDGIGGVCMYRAQWKKWSGYNSVVLNWAVKISTTQRSIKWCELRQNQTTGVWSMYQEGIYAPDANTRWLGSIAMDNNGSIGLSYIKSNSSSIYPGLYYTGRRSCDPLGTLPVTEAVVVAGTGSQTGMNRVGDYAQTTLDPDGVTFWSTSEYMGGTTGSSAAKTRIFSYQITPCTTAAVASVAITISSGSNPTCVGSSVTFTAAPTNGGTAPSYQWQVNGVNVGTNSSNYTTTTLTNGAVVKCIMTSNLAGVTSSPATSNSITMTINSAVAPSVSIALTAGTNPSCDGASKTFAATATNGGTAPTYNWQVDGVSVGVSTATYTTSSLAAGQVVTCVLTSNLSCASTPTASSNGITISFASAVAPAVSIALTSGTNPSASGTSVTFSATATNGGTAPSYQWKVSGTNAGTNAATFTTSTLTNGQIVSCVMTSNAACAVPATATSNTITMSITSPLSYCSATTTSTAYEYISKVVMGTISNTTAASSYTNYSALSTNVTAGTAYSITVTIGNAYSTDKVIIFCDWNNNGVFTDAGETVYTSTAGVGPFTTSITPPATATLGTIRMRIRLTDSGSGANLTSCGVSSYGEVEDYSLNVQAKSLVAIASAEELTNDAISTVRKSEVLTVYPNPSNGTFTIKANNEGDYYLMSESGLLVKAIKLNADNNFSFQVNDLPAGVYVISGQNKFGISKQKIVVMQ
jgi:GEVED domain/Secretion system C-terminal sorting domain